MSWLAPEFALHILNICSKSKFLAENTSIWTLNWKVKKSKFCLSRKLPVEAVANLEKSEGIWDSLNGIVWFLFGCPGWNLIVLHVKRILSSNRITFHSLFRCKYFAEKPCEGETEDKSPFNPKAVISVPLFYPRCFCVTLNSKTHMEIAKSQANRANSCFKFLALWKVYLEIEVKGELYSECIPNITESYWKNLWLQFCRDDNFAREPYKPSFSNIWN